MYYNTAKMIVVNNSIEIKSYKTVMPVFIHY
jgi:hypothetical protein